MKYTSIVAASLFALTRANRKVMEIINDKQKILRDIGFFDRMMERESVKGQSAVCFNGIAVVDGEEFPCENVDFLSFVSAKELDIPEPEHRVGASSADIWGWLSPTNREITILALDNGVAIIDGTDPINPCVIAKMPTRRIVDKWGDVKVYENTLYHVKDTGIQDNDPGAPDGNAEYGIEVYDLLQLDQIDCSVEGHVPINLFPQFVFSGHGRSHNVAINPQSGLLYSTGSQKCRGGLVILDVKTNPMEPVQVGCAEEDGYTHDVQCLTYDGPDSDHWGKEICFAYNEDTLTIWDISDPSAPKVISSTLYPNQVYSHQGWVNDDLTKVLLDDELDEICNNDIEGHPRCDDFQSTSLSGELRTTTNVFDISDLDKPVFEGAYAHPDLAVDHNLYVWGNVHRRGWGGNGPLKHYPDPNFAYMANYLAGVKIVDISSNDYKEWTQAGFFDIAPDMSGPTFAGAWSTYMHPSGVLAVSSIERGLFFLKPNMAFSTEFPSGPIEILPFPDPPVIGGSDSDDDSSDDDQTGGVIALASFMVVGLILVVAFIGYKQKSSQDSSKKQPKSLEKRSFVERSQSRAGSRGPPPVSTKNPMAVALPATDEYSKEYLK